jgi:hypothetical protein
MEKEQKKKPLIMRQKVMFQVVYALIPIAIFSVYLFGWRVLTLLAIVNIAGFLSEYVFARVYKKQVSSAVFVTNFLFALSLPPAVPYWIAVVGIVFGVVFGKMVFGGFGRNVFGQGFCLCQFRSAPHGGICSSGLRVSRRFRAVAEWCGCGFKGHTENCPYVRRELPAA